jgi:hypothetical protein
MLITAAVIAASVDAATVTGVLAGNEHIRKVMAVAAPLLPGKTGEDTDALALLLRLTLNQRHPADGGSAEPRAQARNASDAEHCTTNWGGVTAAGLQT